MSAFDPYYRWLGIPPKDQPPHSYRLLGIELFESDAEVIAQAGDQRMGHLRTFQIGPHAAESQRLLNEVAAARFCLLNPKQRAAYDAQLRAILESHSQHNPPLPPAGPPVMPMAAPFAPGGGPLNPRAMLPVGTPLAASRPAPMGVPVVAQQVFAASAPTPEEDVIDALATLASESDAAYGAERSARHSKDRRGRRQAGRGAGAIRLMLLAVVLAALAGALWARAHGYHLPFLADENAGESSDTPPSKSGKFAAGPTPSAAKKPGAQSAVPVHAGQPSSDDHHSSADRQRAAAQAPPDRPAKSPQGDGKSAAGSTTTRPAPESVKVSGTKLPAASGSAAATNPSQSEGFRPLFNGIDLTGWRTHPSEPGSWRVENGVLVASGTGTSHLYTQRGDYRNARVRASMRISRDSNSGIFVRSTFGPKAPAPLPNGYETRVFGQKDAMGKSNSGLIKWYASPPSGSSSFPNPAPISLPNDWFTLEFRAAGNELSSFINGQEVCQGVDAQRHFDSGHIAVQFRGPHNGPLSAAVEFRSIEALELP